MLRLLLVRCTGFCAFRGAALVYGGGGVPRSALPALNLLLVGFLLVVVVVFIVLSPLAPLALEELVFLCLLQLRALPLPRPMRCWPAPLPVLPLLCALPWRCSGSAALPILSTTAPPALPLLLPPMTVSVVGVALECILSSVAVAVAGFVSLAVVVVVVVIVAR